MKKQLYILLFSMLLLQNCSFLEQNSFIETKIISNSLNEKIVYRYSQTGTDHYKVDFYAISKSDSTKLFEHSINDAFFTSNTYRISEDKDRVIVHTKLFPAEKKLTTKSGRSIIFTNRQ